MLTLFPWLVVIQVVGGAIARVVIAPLMEEFPKRPQNWIVEWLACGGTFGVAVAQLADELKLRANGLADQWRASVFRTCANSCLQR